MTGSRDRGQAYTLESLIAALLLVTALLFALQSVVITSSSAGTLDRDTQAELHQESSDLLVTAANDGELSRTVRYWDRANESFANGEGNNLYFEQTGYERDVVPIQDFGESLNHTVREGNQYNLLLTYDDGSGNRQTQRLVFQGTPGVNVVETSYTVTLTDDQLVTGPDEGSTTLAEAEDDAPIPDAYSGPIYNVVEVRLVIW